MAIRKTTNKTVTRRRTTPAKRTRRASTARATTTVRRRRPAKKGMLAEMFNPAMVQNSAKAMMSGAVGGFASVTIMKLTPQQTPTTQALILGGAAFASAALLKMPNLAAGMSAIAVYRLMDNAGMLADDMDLANYADPIEALPMVLNEDGTENMYLAALSRGDEDMYLSENYQTAYAPTFGGF